MSDEMIFNFARQMLQQNPEAANTSLGKELIAILDSKDYNRGQQIGNNLCETYGDQRNNAFQKAANFFGLLR